MNMFIQSKFSKFCVESLTFARGEHAGRLNLHLLCLVSWVILRFFYPRFQGLSSFEDEVDTVPFPSGSKKHSSSVHSAFRLRIVKTKIKVM